MKSDAIEPTVPQSGTVENALAARGPDPSVSSEASPGAQGAERAERVEAPENPPADNPRPRNPRFARVKRLAREMLELLKPIPGSWFSGDAEETVLSGRPFARANVAAGSDLPEAGFEPERRRVDRLGPWLPHLGVDDATGLVYLEGDEHGIPEALGFTIEMRPQTGTSQSMQASLSAIAAVPFPEGTVLTTTLSALSPVDPWLECMERAMEPGLRSLAPDAAALLSRAVHSRTEFLRAAARGENPTPEAKFLVRRFRLFLHVAIPYADPEAEASLQEASNLCRAVIAMLEQSHLAPRQLNATELLSLLREHFNPHKALENDLAPRPASPFEELRLQVPDPDTEARIGKNAVAFTSALGSDPDPIVFCALGVVSYPREITLADIAELTGGLGRSGAQIPAPFLINCSWKVLDQRAERDRLAAKAVRTQQLAGSQVGRFSPYWQEQNREFRTALRSFETAGGVSFVRHTLAVYPKASELASSVHAVEALGRRRGFDIRPDRAMHAQSLLWTAPLGATPAMAADMRRCRRFERRTTATALQGLPVLAEWRGTGPRQDEKIPTPLLTLTGRKGQIFFVDPFANPHGNYSMTVVGKSGSGKSVTLNALSLSTVLSGGRVWVIDAGRSYVKTAALLDGLFLEIGEDSVWDLDPFALAAPNAGEDASDAAERLEMIVRIVEALAGSRALSDSELSILRACVSDVVREVRRTHQGPGSQEILETRHMPGTHDRPASIARRRSGMDALRARLLAYRLPGLEDRPVESALLLAERLHPYTEDEPLAKWFNGTGKRLDFSKAFTVLELDGLAAHRELRRGVLLTLMLSIEREMRRLPKSMTKLVIIDEAWDLMGDGSAGHFIETGYRRARKLNAGYVTATQSIADYWLSDTAQAAWRTADTRIFLRQDADGIEALEHDGKFSKDDAWLKWAITSLTTVAGAWSEMVVKVGDEPPAIGRLALDPYTRTAFSTHPADLARTDAWRARGLSLADAIARAADGLDPPAFDDIRSKDAPSPTHETR